MSLISITFVLSSILKFDNVSNHMIKNHYIQYVKDSVNNFNYIYSNLYMNGNLDSNFYIEKVLNVETTDDTIRVYHDFINNFNHSEDVEHEEVEEEHDEVEEVVEEEEDEEEEEVEVEVEVDVDVEEHKED